MWGVAPLWWQIRPNGQTAKCLPSWLARRIHPIRFLKTKAPDTNVYSISLVRSNHRWILLFSRTGLSCRMYVFWALDSSSLVISLIASSVPRLLPRPFSKSLYEAVNLNVSSLWCPLWFVTASEDWKSRPAIHRLRFVCTARFRHCKHKRLLFSSMPAWKRRNRMRHFY